MLILGSIQETLSLALYVVKNNCTLCIWQHRSTLDSIQTKNTNFRGAVKRLSYEANIYIYIANRMFHDASTRTKASVRTLRLHRRSLSFLFLWHDIRSPIDGTHRFMRMSRRRRLSYLCVWNSTLYCTTCFDYIPSALFVQHRNWVSLASRAPLDEVDPVLKEDSSV